MARVGTMVKNPEWKWYKFWIPRKIFKPLESHVIGMNYAPNLEGILLRKNIFFQRIKK
jgi:hypothetical protein